MVCRMEAEGFPTRITFGRAPRRTGDREPCQCLGKWHSRRGELSQGCVASLRTGKEAGAVGPD